MLENVHHYPVRIYYEDTDAGGVVYNANYLKFFERARTEWLRELGINQSNFLANNIAFVVRKVDMDLLLAAKLDEQLVVSSEFTQIKRASFSLYQKILNEQQQVLCTLSVVIACVNTSNNQFKPCAMPQKISGVLPRVS